MNIVLYYQKWGSILAPWFGGGVDDGKMLQATASEANAANTFGPDVPNLTTHLTIALRCLFERRLGVGWPFKQEVLGCMIHLFQEIDLRESFYLPPRTINTRRLK